MDIPFGSNSIDLKVSKFHEDVRKSFGVRPALKPSAEVAKGLAKEILSGTFRLENVFAISEELRNCHYVELDERAHAYVMPPESTGESFLSFSANSIQYKNEFLSFNPDVPSDTAPNYLLSVHQFNTSRPLVSRILIVQPREQGNFETFIELRLYPELLPLVVSSSLSFEQPDQSFLAKVIQGNLYPEQKVHEIRQKDQDNYQVVLPIPVPEKKPKDGNFVLKTTLAVVIEDEAAGGKQMMDVDVGINSEGIVSARARAAKQ